MILSNTLDRLDKKLLKKLLFYFQFDELIILRQFDDKFKSVIDEIIEENVIWFKRNTDLTDFRYLYYLNDLIFNNCLISSSISNFRSNDDIHIHIKKLLTCNPYLLMNLNLINLQHLEIENKNFIKSPDINSIELNTIELKNLKIDLDKKNLIFYLNCPNLENIYINGSIDNLVLSNPYSLKNLTCNSNTTLRKCKNIEQVTFIDLNYLNYPGKIFEDLKRLKKIFILATSEESLIKLRKENNETRLGCKIYFKNCDIDAELFNYFLFFDISLQTLNQNSIEILIDRKNDLNGLLPQLQLAKIDLENISDDILRKFKFINSIKISMHISFNRFIKILKYYNLSELNFKIKLTNDYLKQIPIYQKQLRKIKITDCDDLTFLLDLKFLIEIKTTKLMDKDIFKKLIQNLKYLHLICIGKFFRIELNKNIRCFLQTKLKFDEDKNIFLLTTIDLIDNLSKLFSFNIPAIV